MTEEGAPPPEPEIASAEEVQAAELAAQKAQEEQQKLEKSLQIQVVDVSDAVTNNAIDHADEYIGEQTTQTGVRGFIKRIWKGNYARDYIRQREIHHGRQEIIASNNIFALDGGTEAEHANAVGAVVERFTQDYIHDGETNTALEEVENGQSLSEGLQGLVTAYARGEINDDALTEEKTRLINEFAGQVHETSRNKGLLLADNVIEVARNARAAVEHGIGEEAISAALSARTGDARTGVRTEAHQTATDKVLDKLYSTKVGSLVNEGTLALAAGVVASVTRMTTTKAGTALGATVGMGVGAGVLAGAREHQRIGQERRLHSRQRAEGQPAAEGASGKRREQMEETRYESLPAEQLTDLLGAASEALAAEPNIGSMAAALQIVGETQARVRLSDKEGIDLINYSDKTSVEDERLAMDIRLAQAKVALKSALESADEATLTELGIESPEDMAEALDGHVQEVYDVLEADMTAKDAVFNKLRRHRTAKMAAVGFVSAVVVGTAIQEARAAVMPSLRGVFENPDSAGTRRTLLAGLLRPNHSHFTGGRQAIGSGEQLSKNVQARLPEGYKLHEVAANHWELFDAKGKMVSKNVGFTQDGHLTAASSALLAKQGFKTNELADHYTTQHTEIHTITRSPDDYVNSHPEQFTHVERQLWYDNNTPHVFDKNELRMDWGGHNGTGIDAQGNYVFNVSRMLPNGSYHGMQAADAQNLIHEGKMGIALSVTKGTQKSVLMVKIDAQGNAVFDHNNPAYASLFETRDGSAHFTGAYAEAVQLTGTNARGETTMKMLATVVGEEHAKPITDTITNIVKDDHTRFITSFEAPAIKAPTPIEIPFVAPIYGRRGMEALGDKPRPTNPELVTGGYGGRSLEELRDWLKHDPSLLASRHEVVAEDGSKQWVEADGSPVERSVERERQVLETYIDKQRETNPAHVEAVERVVEAIAPMDDDCRVSINVPAWMEAKNLEHFLDEYLHQTDRAGNPIDLKLFEVNVLVNRKTGSEADNSVEVINTFVDEYQARTGKKPPVNYYDVELDPPYNNVGYARKLLTDAVVMRSVKRPDQKQPLYIETEDADLVNVDPQVVNNVITKMDAEPQLDAVRGVQDRAPEYLKDNDYLFIRRRAADFFEVLARNKRFRNPDQPNWDFTWNRIVTGGWNTAYSAEIYAQIGGYDVVVAGEDMSLGEKMTMVRGDGSRPNLEVVGKVPSRSDSSPRRFIHEIFNDKAAYEDFGNEEDNEAIREQSIEEMLDSISYYSRITDENQDDFTNYLNHQFAFLQSVTPTTADAIQLTKRMLFFLGLKKDDYTISTNGLEVQNWDNVRAALNSYRDRYEQRLV